MPLSFLCDQLVSQQHISHLFVQAMAAAGLGLRKSVKSRAKSSTQGWSPNSGQAAEDESGSLLTCSFPSKVSIHLRAVSHYLNSRISKLALRRSKLLQWISNRMLWFSTSLLRATRSRLQRMLWVSTSQPGTMRHHSQGKPQL